MSLRLQASSTLPGLSPNAQIGAAVQARFRVFVLLAAQALWLAMVVLSLGVFVATTPNRYNQLLTLGAQNEGALRDLNITNAIFAEYLVLLDILTVVFYAVVGILIFARKPKEWVALFASLALITTGTTITRPADSLMFIDPMLYLPMLLLFMFAEGALVFFLYSFPDGRFVPGWTRWLVLLTVAYVAVYYLLPLIRLGVLRWPPAPISSWLLLAIALGVVIQIYRYLKVSSPAQHQQTKWVVYGFSIGTLGLLSFLLIVPALDPQVLKPSTDRLWYILAGVPLFYLSLIMLPLSIGISILRYRLWQIDLLINRTLVYVPLTAILAGLFAALITLTQKLFLALTGAQSDAATVLTTLIVVAAFTPIKDRLQGLVDKRFKDTCDASKRLSLFREQILSRMSPVYPVQVTRRLLDESVAAFGAEGGAAYLDNNGQSKLIYSTGEWKDHAGVSAPLEAHSGTFGRIALGPKRDGTEYTDEDLQELRSTAQCVALAIEADRPVK